MKCRMKKCRKEMTTQERAAYGSICESCYVGEPIGGIMTMTDREVRVLEGAARDCGGVTDLTGRVTRKKIA